MRLAILSDIHGNLTALEAVLADMEKVGEVDLIWCLGDLAAMGGHPAECIRRIRDLREQYGKEKFKVIGGNADRYLVTGERFPQPPAKDEETFQKLYIARKTSDTIINWNLSQLGWEDYQFLTKILRRELRHPVKDYGMVIGFHAIPGDDESMALRPDADDEEAHDALLDRAGRLAIGGHTHTPMDRDLGNWRFVNPGSIGLSATNPGKAEWVLLTFADGEVDVDLRAVSYDVERVLTELEQSGYPHPEWAASRLRPSS